MNGYKYVHEDEKILAEFPGLTQAELDEVNGFFSKYLFFENVPEGRRVWTSCCHKDGVLFERLTRTETPKHREVLRLDHNEGTVCPFCGLHVTAKNRKKLGKGQKLKEYIPVLFLRSSEDGETIYAQGYWAYKGYLSEPAAYPLYMPTSVYRFRHGEAMRWERQWSRGDDWPMVRQDGKWTKEPFTEGNGFYFRYCGYKVVGIEELGDSFLRYAGADVRLTKEEDDLWRYTRKRKYLMRFLGIASLYPENVEMLMKAGMHEVLIDYVYRQKKNSSVIRWGEADPRKAFGLSGAELKEFLSGDRKLETLAVYKKMCKMDKKITLLDVEKMLNSLGEAKVKEVAAKVKRIKGISVRKLMKYLDGMAGPRCHGGGVTLDYVTQYWIDYIDAAVALGYDLTNPIIQMPRELQQAHDNAVRSFEIVNLKQGRKSKDKRYPSLQRRYGFETDRYFIRAPFNGKEIVDEGTALKHCVGGYAERHESGAVSILFLRNRARPGKSLVTIQMRGNKLVQVHGYHNERTTCSENPKCIPARQLYAEILDPWLAWVAAGSKRDKDGKPRMPKKKEVAVA